MATVAALMLNLAGSLFDVSSSCPDMGITACASEDLRASMLLAASLEIAAATAAGQESQAKEAAVTGLPEFLCEVLEEGSSDAISEALANAVSDDEGLFEKLDGILKVCLKPSCAWSATGERDYGWTLSSGPNLQGRSRRVHILGWMALRLQESYPCEAKTHAQRKYLRYISEELPDRDSEVSPVDRIRLMTAAAYDETEQYLTPSFPSAELVEMILPYASSQEKELRRACMRALVSIACLYREDSESTLSAAASVLSEEDLEFVRRQMNETLFPGPLLSEAEYHVMRTSPAKELFGALICGDPQREECARRILTKERLGDVDLLKVFIAEAQSAGIQVSLWDLVLRLVEPPVLEADSQERKTLISMFLDRIELEMQSLERTSNPRAEQWLEQMLLGSPVPLRKSDIKAESEEGAIHEEERILALLFKGLTCDSAAMQMYSARGLGKIAEKREDLAGIVWQNLQEALKRRQEFSYEPLSDDPVWQNDFECNPEPEVLASFEEAIRSAETAMERYKETVAFPVE